MPRKRLDMDEHGVYAYTRLGCRCETCRAKVAQQRAKYRNPDNGVDYKKRFGSSRLKLSLDPFLSYMERSEQIHLIDRSTLARWRRSEMSVYDIDRLCIKWGTHPALVYGDAFYQDIQGDAA